MDKSKKILKIAIIIVSIVYFGLAVNYEINYKSEDEYIKKIDFEIKNKEVDNKNIIVNGNFDSNISNSEKIFFYINNVVLEFYLNNKLIFSSGVDTNVRWESISNINIASDDHVMIKMHPISGTFSQKAYQYVLNNVYYGTELGLLHSKIKKNIFNIISSVIVFALGVSMIVGVIIFHSFEFPMAKTFMPGALILIYSSIIIFINFDYITLITNKIMFVNAIDFIFKMLLIGGILQYLLEFFTEKIYKTISKIILGCWTVLYLLCAMRRFLHLFPNVYSVDIVIGSVFLLVIINIIIFRFDVIKSKKNYSKRIFLGTKILYICVLYEIIRYIIVGKFFRPIFILGLVVFAIMNIAEMIKNTKYKIKQADRARELEAALTKSKIDLMLSQIKPHFIFNALAVIENLCTKEPAKAREALDYFSTYLKSNMNGIDENHLISFEKELRHVESYLYIEKIRKEERLNVKYDIQTRDFSIPPLTIQTLVENAVRHGINGKEEGGTLVLATREMADKIYVEIIDDGIGFDINQHKVMDDRKHIGMDNSISRIENLCKGRVVIESSINLGTKVTLILPKNNV